MKLTKSQKESLTKIKLLSEYLQDRIKDLEKETQKIVNEITDKNVSDSIFDFVWNETSLEELLNTIKEIESQRF